MAAFSASMLCSSCLPRVDFRDLLRLRDSLDPTVVVTSPADGSIYGDEVVFQGSVTDSANEQGEDGEITEVAYSLLGQVGGGDIELSDSGAFTFQFATAELDSPISVQITARDWNGNTSTATVTLLRDETTPTVVILSPANLSAYAATVQVTGRVYDTVNADGDSGEVVAVAWSATPGSLGDDVPFDENGDFTFQFTTTGLSGDIAVTVSATDRADNQGFASVTLTGGGAFAAMVLAPDNGAITVSWDPVFLAQSYTLYYTTDGTEPSAANGTTVNDVSSPHEVSGLPNGSRCGFKLLSHSSTGPDNVSSPRYAIPLSRLTLAPSVRGDYRRIRIEWAPIAAMGQGSGVEFSVLRSSTESGAFTSVATTALTSYTDTDLEPGAAYFYKIAPSAESSLESYSNYGVAGVFAAEDEYVIGSRLITGTSRSVAAAGSYAYVVTSSPSSLYVVDASAPRSPVVADGLSITDGGNYPSVAVVGGYAYVADGNQHLLVIRVSDPSNIVQVGSCTISGATDVAISGTTAYVAAGTNGLRVVDVSEPEEVTDSSLQPGSWDGGTSTASGVATDGSYAYLAHGSDGLYVVRLSDMTTVDSWSAGAGPYAYDVTLSGTWAFVAYGTHGLAVLDVEDPEATEYETTLGSIGTARGVSVFGDYAYAAAGTDGVHVVDVSAPATPFLLRTVSIGAAAEAAAVAATQDRLYAADSGSGLKVLDRSFPLLVDSCSAGSYAAGGTATDVDVRGDYAVVAVSGQGVAVLDVSDPSSPTQEGLCTYGGAQANAVQISGPFAFVADGDTGYLKIVDFSTPSAPSVVGSCLVGTAAYDIAVRGQYAFVGGRAGTTGKVFVVDVADPTTPSVLAASWQLGVSGEYLEGLAITGDYLLGAAIGAGVPVLDISDPASLSGDSEMDLYSATQAWDVDTQGDLVFIARLDLGIEIADMSQATNLEVVQSAWYDGTYVEYRGVYASGGYLFLPDQWNLKLKVLSVSLSESTKVALVDSYPLGALPKAVRVLGKYALVADGPSLKVIDLVSGN